MAYLSIGIAWLWLVAVIAILSEAALVGIIARLVTTTLDNSDIEGVSLAATIFDILTLAFLLAVTVTILPSLNRSVRRSAQPFTRAGGILGAAVTLVASVISMYVLAWTYSPERLGQNDSSSQRLASAGFAVWALALTSQLMLLCLLALQQTQRDDGTQEETRERLPPASSSKRSISVHLKSLAPPLPFFPASPTYSTTSSQSPRSSLRHSLHQSVHPVTSKTRLTLSNPFSGKGTQNTQSRETSIDGARNDGFQSWDTSAVQTFAEHPMQQQRAVQRARLETIPGSRPASPAKPLDGPFPDPPTPEEPTLPQSPASFADDSIPSPFRNASVSTSRRPSTANSQSHIHPLFRTESPAPPPLASPGTTVTASPLAGQVLSGEAWDQHRIRSDSPYSSPLLQARSRAPSLKSQKSWPWLVGEAEDVPPVPSSKPAG